MIMAPTSTSPNGFDSMNTVSILIETQPDNRVLATVWGLPDCQALQATREEALADVRALLAKRLNQAEVVTFSMPFPKSEHLLVKLAGRFKDDPYFDEMLAAIAAYRHELDAESDQLDLEQPTL